MNTYSLATVKILFGALFQDREFPGAELAVNAIKCHRVDSQELFAYAGAISKNEVTPYYETLCAQMRNVIEERDAIRKPVFIQFYGRISRPVK